MAVDTREYYTNPMDIVTFLDGDKADGFMQTVLNKAFMFHEKNGISPIIKTEKQDFYLVDYYFLVHTFSDYVFGLLETVDEEVALLVKEQIVTDFGANSNYKNKRLLINLLDYQNVLFSSTDKKWTYTLKRYRGKFNDKLFLISGVVIDSNFIKEKLGHKTIEQLEKMASNSQYILEAIGNKAMQVNFSASANQPVWSFS